MHNHNTLACPCTPVCVLCVCVYLCVCVFVSDHFLLLYNNALYNALCITLGHSIYLFFLKSSKQEESQSQPNKDYENRTFIWERQRENPADEGHFHYTFSAFPFLPPSSSLHVVLF